MTYFKHIEKPSKYYLKKKNPFTHHLDLMKKKLFGQICFRLLKSNIKVIQCYIYSWRPTYTPLDHGFQLPFLPIGTTILTLLCNLHEMFLYFYYLYIHL